MKPPNSKYLMESPREAGRLSAKVDPYAFVNTYLKSEFDQLKKKQRQVRILDVGCGSGVITAAIARLYPKFQVFGVDLEKHRYVEMSKRSKAIFVTGNANQLPFSSNEYDFVFTRFMLEYMQKPMRVVSEMRRVARAGGRILIQDLDGQLVTHYPYKDKFKKDCEKVIERLAETGFDPYVGRKLYYYFIQRRLKDVRLQLEPYHLYAGKIDAHNYFLWKSKLEIAGQHIEKALGSRKKAAAFIRSYLAYLCKKNTLSFSFVFTVCGTK